VSDRVRILLASNNAKKLGELRTLCEPLGVEVVSPSDVGGVPEVDEDRPDFEGNAEKKACAGARATGLACLADDSGLCVDALDGAPGVRSARFAGESSDDAANNAHLLERLDGVPEDDRGAHFVCCLVLVAADGTRLGTWRGEAHGRILRAARGAGGFGYDPLFEFHEAGRPGFGQAFAELSAEAKAAVGHRGRAVRALAADLPALLPSLAPHGGEH
jgi:XTP/dITP diphosphohydrolase